MGAPSATGRTVPVITALVLRRILAEPGVWSALTLAHELGETPRRVQKIIVAVQQAGWEVEREEPGQRLTLRDPLRPRASEQRDRLIEMYRAGKRREEMAEALGITLKALDQRIMRLLAEGAMERRARPKRRYTSPLWERAKGGPFPATVEELALRIYDTRTPETRQLTDQRLTDWVSRGHLIRTAPGVYDLPPI